MNANDYDFAVEDVMQKQARCAMLRLSGCSPMLIPSTQYPYQYRWQYECDSHTIANATIHGASPGNLSSC